MVGKRGINSLLKKEKKKRKKDLFPPFTVREDSSNNNQRQHEQRAHAHSAICFINRDKGASGKGIRHAYVVVTNKTLLTLIISLTQ